MVSVRPEWFPCATYASTCELLTSEVPAWYFGVCSFHHGCCCRCEMPCGMPGRVRYCASPVCTPAQMGGPHPGAGSEFRTGTVLRGQRTAKSSGFCWSNTQERQKNVLRGSTEALCFANPVRGPPSIDAAPDPPLIYRCCEHSAGDCCCSSELILWEEEQGN